MTEQTYTYDTGRVVFADAPGRTLEHEARVFGLNRLDRVLRDLAEAGYYGKVTLSFEDGRLTTVRKEETLKPPTE